MPLAVFHTQYIGFVSFIANGCSKIAIWKFWGFLSSFLLILNSCTSFLRIYRISYTLNAMCYKLSYHHCYHPQHFSGDEQLQKDWLIDSFLSSNYAQCIFFHYICLSHILLMTLNIYNLFSSDLGFWTWSSSSGLYASWISGSICNK